MFLSESVKVTRMTLSNATSKEVLLIHVALMSPNDGRYFRGVSWQLNVICTLESGIKWRITAGDGLLSAKDVLFSR